MKIFLSFILCLVSVVSMATTFPCPIVGGKPTLTSMSGHAAGDVMTIAAGTYTGFNFRNLTWITIIPLTPGTVYFTGQGDFLNNIGIEWSDATFSNSSGAAINCDATSNRHIYWHHFRFVDVSSTCIHADGTWPWTVGDTTTLAFYDLRMDSISETRCPALLRVGFGSLANNHPTPPNISDSVQITRFVSVQTTGTAEEGTEVRFSGVFRLYCSYWNVTSTTHRGPSGDVGCIYIKGGDVTAHDIYRNGGPGYILRVYGNTQSAKPRNVILYNCGQFNSTSYGLVDFRYDPLNDISTDIVSTGFDFWSLTKGNALDSAGGYGANLAVIGNVDPAKLGRIRNCLGFNIAKSGSAYLLKNQSSGTYTADTANGQYWASATLAKLDSTRIITTNYTGSFAGYWPTAASTGSILGGGTTNPYTSVDFAGSPNKVPPDLGYLQRYISATTPLTFTRLTSDYSRPMAGAEQWNGSPWDNVNDPYIPASVSVPQNWYSRFLWSADFEDAVQGSYNFSVFDARINAAIDAGQLFSFGIMPMCTGCIQRDWTYPTYLHTLMQAEATNSKDWFYTADAHWVPNWNSPNYQARWAALLTAVAAHIQSGTHSGKNYRDVIGYVDIRGYGETGEWNNYPWHGQEPTGRVATAASLDSIISKVGQAFPNNQLQICFGVMDPGNASIVPPATSTYFLNYSNNYGKIGWRRDNIGDPGFDAALDPQPGILTQWQYAPIGGEPLNDASLGNYPDVPREVTKYKMSYFGNGNWSNVNASNATFVANARQASFNAGARITLDSGNVTANPSTGGTWNIQLYWKNIGPAPVYDRRWKIVYELRKTSDQSVQWRDTSDFNLRLFLPQATDSIYTDNYLLTGVAASTYNLHVWIKDSTGYVVPFPLAITGRQGDGSYILKSNLVITTSAVPTANAGLDQAITLPTSTVTLSGSLSSGSISSYLWTQVSGPACTIATPTTVTTNITGLTQGTFIFKLSLNAGASVDSVTVTVNPLPPAVANAGVGQNISLPTTSTTLNGSGSTGTITSYLWTTVSGPNTPGFSTPTAVSTVVSGLTSGSYIFQLSINGGMSIDTMIVIVNPLPSNGITIFTTQVPSVGTGNDGGGGIELGLKFRSSLSGYVTGVRFYKTSGNTGTHIGELYDNTCTRLAQATFTNESATGWQTVTFATPIFITKDTQYMVSYFSSLGNYTGEPNYFNGAVMNYPLIALPGPGNGVYDYIGAPTCPSSTPGNNPNYWVDVVFNASSSQVLLHRRGRILFKNGN